MHASSHGRSHGRVALVGCNSIDPSDVCSLVLSDAVNELFLTGPGRWVLAEDLQRLIDERDIVSHALFRTETISCAARADIAIIALASDDPATKTKQECLKKRASDMRLSVRSLIKAGFQGIFLVIANPIDLMAQVAQQASGFAPHRVIGLGNPDNEFDEDSFGSRLTATWCTAECQNVQFFDNCDPICPAFNSALKKRNGSNADLPTFPGNRISSLASCVKQVCEAILRDERVLLPVSTLVTNEFGISGLYMTVPCVLGRGGVETTVELQTTVQEKRRLLSYAANLRTAAHTVL